MPSPMSAASPEEQLASLESLIACARTLSKISGKREDTFYPHICWWDLERYLKLVRRGAQFELRGDRLCWDITDEHATDEGEH